MSLTANYVPRGSADDLFPGTWFLTRVDDRFRREYARTPLGPPPGPERLRASAAEVRAREGRLAHSSGVVTGGTCVLVSSAGPQPAEEDASYPGNRQSRSCSQ